MRYGTDQRQQLPMMHPHVHLDGIGHSFRHKGPATLSGIDLAVGRGEAVALVGSSGCGKSTLLQIVAGLLHPHSGRVTIGGVAVTRPSPRWNLMFQRPSLFPWMSVAENVALGLRYAGQRRGVAERVAKLLELVGLTEHAADNVQTLSGGQQQRVALARSLATEPELLLLDEPFSALDAFTRASLQKEVRSIARSLGLTVIIVTHDVDEAILMAERAVVMAAKPGRVVAEVRFDAAVAAGRDSPAFRLARQSLLHPFETAAVAA